MVDVNRQNTSYAVTQDFLATLKANVLSVTTPTPSGSSVTHSIQSWATNYNDKQLSTKANYPVIIVEKASVPDEFLTFRKKQTDGSVEVQVHCTNSIATSKFADLIKETIEDQATALKSMGIKKLYLDTDDSDTLMRNSFKDHWALLVFKFEYEFNYGN